MPILASADAVKVNGIYYNLTSNSKVAEVTTNPDRYTGKVVIPKTVTYQGVKYTVKSIGDKAFYSSTELTSVTLPNSITSIGYKAFDLCQSLASINLPSSLTSIGNYAFLDCFCLTLTSATIPDGLTSIGEGTFSGCQGITSLIIPNSVTSIGGHAFQNCRGLTSMIIPNSVISIGECAFSGCNGLTSVAIGNSVTSIGNNAFSNCSSLTSVTIPNSVTYIGSNAFFGSGLTSVTIGRGVTEIDDGAFSYCSELEDVYCFATNVPNTHSDAFTESNIENATLHVLKGCLDAYKAVEPWKNFKKKVEVTAKVTLSKSKATIQKGKTVTLKATVSPSSLSDKSVTWKSSDKKIATVTSKGKVKGVKAGTATITCISNLTGAKATCKVTVGYVSLNKTEVAVKKGKTVTLKATVYPSSLKDKSVTWESSDTKIATVSSAGKVKGVKAGPATITCTSNATGLSTTCKVTVGYVKLDQTEVTVKKGKTVTLTATVYPSKLEDKTVTWKSSDKSIATVTSGGKIKGIKAGTATITCTSNATGLSTTCTVTVTATSGSRSLDGDDDETTGIEENVVAVEPFDVYDLSGHKVLNKVTSLDGLPNGIYIVNGKKFVIK